MHDDDDVDERCTADHEAMSHTELVDHYASKVDINNPTHCVGFSVKLLSFLSQGPMMLALRTAVEAIKAGHNPSEAIDTMGVVVFHCGMVYALEQGESAKRILALANQTEEPRAVYDELMPPAIEIVGEILDSFIRQNSDRD